MTRSALLAASGVLVGIVAIAGCDGQVVIGHDSDTPEVAPVPCGDRTCVGAERCCQTSEEDCAPRCMAVRECPVAWSPRCGGGPRPPRPPLHWFVTCPDPGCTPSDAGASPVCPPEGAPCGDPTERCGVPSPATCGAIMVCAEQDPKAGICLR